MLTPTDKAEVERICLLTVSRWLIGAVESIEARLLAIQPAKPATEERAAASPPPQGSATTPRADASQSPSPSKTEPSSAASPATAGSAISGSERDGAGRELAKLLAPPAARVGLVRYVLCRIGAYRRKEAEEIASYLTSPDEKVALAPHLAKELWFRPVHLAMREGMGKEVAEQAIKAVWNDVGLGGKKPHVTVASMRLLLAALPRLDEKTVNAPERLEQLIGKELAEHLNKGHPESLEPAIAVSVKAAIVKAHGDAAFGNWRAASAIEAGKCPSIGELLNLCGHVLDAVKA